MDGRIIDHFKSALLTEFVVYCAEKDIKPSAENCIKYMLQYNLIQDKDVKRFFVLDIVDKNVGAGKNKTEVVYSISDHFDTISTRTVWSIIRHQARRFWRRKDRNLI